MLEALNRVMLRKIEEEMAVLKFSIMADETSDICHHEQMVIVLRYHDKNTGKPIERLVALQKLEKTNAESIFNEINLLLKRMHLHWQNFLGVCFDGASAMAGQFTGVQARCKNENADILFVHRYAHCLNLVLVDSCISHRNNPLIFDFFGTIQVIYNFIEGSPQRHVVFEKIVKQTDTELKTLKSLSETRWACRTEAVSAVYEQLSEIVEAIEDIKETTTVSKVKVTASGILRDIKSFDFIISLEIMQPILEMIVVVSRILQRPGIDLCEAMSRIDNLADALYKFRTDDDIYDQIYTKAEDTCKKLNVEIPPPKRRKVSCRIDENPSTAATIQTKKDGIKYFTFYKVLDDLSVGLNERFSQETKLLISSTSRLIKLMSNNEVDFDVVSNTFHLSKSRLKAEVKILAENFPLKKPFSTIPDWLTWFGESDSRKVSFREYFKMLSSFSVIPVTSCTCERCFSKLQIVLSKLRNSMSQERLFHLMVPFVEQELASSIDFSEVVDEFKRMVPFDRRMPL